MENEELELMTGKLIWAVLPPVVAVWVGLQVFSWLIQRFAGVRAWNAYDQGRFDSTMQAVDAAMKVARK